MILKEDGSKWACRPCLMGHRVGRCKHTDRDLVIVPHQGRPITQCQHCRFERKKRSAHIKCTCADPRKLHHAKENCLHLRENRERTGVEWQDGINAVRNTDDEISRLIAVAQEQGCCCHHGGKCSCAIFLGKPNEAGLSRRKLVPPVVEASSSDSTITVAAPGHQQRMRHNKSTAPERRMPYSASETQSQTDQEVSTPAYRPVADLVRTSSTSHEMFKAASHDKMQTNPSVDALSSRGSTQYPGMSNSNSSWAWSTSTDIPQEVQPVTTAFSASMQLEIDRVSSMNSFNSLAAPDIWDDYEDSMALINQPQSNARSMLPDFFLNADIATANLNDDDWQTPVGTYDATGADSVTPQGTFNIPSMDSGQIWQTTNLPPTSRFPPSGSLGLRDTAQPQWRSGGSINTADDDILAELFPSTETNESTFTWEVITERSREDGAPT